MQRGGTEILRRGGAAGRGDRQQVESEDLRGRRQGRRGGTARAGDGRDGLGGPGEGAVGRSLQPDRAGRSEEHTSELQSLMRISYAVFCLQKTTVQHIKTQSTETYYRLRKPSHHCKNIT